VDSESEQLQGKKKIPNILFHPLFFPPPHLTVFHTSCNLNFSGLLANEGVFAFWKGLAFAYGRELSYTSIKLGAYAPVRDALGAGADAPFYLKFLAGAITGGVGSAVGNPFDV
jgi:hypothetical protein